MHTFEMSGQQRLHPVIANVSPARSGDGCKRLVAGLSIVVAGNR